MSKSPASMSSLEKKVQQAVKEGADHLSLADSFIEDEGCAVVADALKGNRTIKSLDMRGETFRNN